MPSRSTVRDLRDLGDLEALLGAELVGAGDRGGELLQGDCLDAGSVRVQQGDHHVARGSPGAVGLVLGPVVVPRQRQERVEGILSGLGGGELLTQS